MKQCHMCRVPTKGTDICGLCGEAEAFLDAVHYQEKKKKMSDVEKLKRKIDKDLSDEGPGYTTFSVSDGRYFGFSKKRLQEFLAKCETSGQDSMLVFIQDKGLTIDDLPEPN